MFDALRDTAFWSTSAEVIAGLVVAVVFADVVASAPAQDQVRWYATLRWAALVGIAGGLTVCLLALAVEDARQPWAALVVAVSVAALAGVLGIRLVKLHELARDRAAADQAPSDGEGTGT